jgi:hypothetical protein
VKTRSRYPEKRLVYAGHRVALFHISPFDLFIEGEPVITKLETKSGSLRKRHHDTVCAKAITIGN